MSAPPHDKKLVISVRTNGEASVSIFTSSVSQAEQYMLNVLELNNQEPKQPFSTSWTRIHRNRRGADRSRRPCARSWQSGK